MSTLNKQATPKRYSNPELFERLAMEYAIGMLHGQAKRRFETLMQRHLYLQAITEVYEQKFSGLAELAPPKTPPERVWKNIRKQVGLKRAVRQGGAWWQSWQAKFSGFVLSVLLISGSLFTFMPNPSTDHYISVLKSDKQAPIAIATLKKGEGIYIELLKKMRIPKNMELKLWCLPKSKQDQPMIMGTLVTSKQKSIIKMEAKMWQSLNDVSKLAISLEPIGTQPIMNKDYHNMLYQGSLNLIAANH
jgi:anti-sigma-K factor RskA